MKRQKNDRGSTRIGANHKRIHHEGHEGKQKIGSRQTPRYFDSVCRDAIIFLCLKHEKTWQIVISARCKAFLNAMIMSSCAYLFGSVAAGADGPLSDLDIAVLLKPGADFSVGIGNILMTQRDRFSGYRPADESYYELLRGNLSQT